SDAPLVGFQDEQSVNGKGAEGWGLRVMGLCVKSERRAWRTTTVVRRMKRRAVGSCGAIYGGPSAPDD
ncbi:hypothetical protein NDU88_006049, partial [Pleurodeles waltl]